MRQTYLDMAIKMAELGSESLQATYRHSRQFLRGVTDFDDEGNYAWKRGAYAATAYQFSKKFHRQSSFLMLNPSINREEKSRVVLVL